MGTAALAAMTMTLSAAVAPAFAPVRYLSTGSTQTDAVAVADVNADGRLDLEVSGDNKPDLIMSVTANEPRAAINVFAQQAGGLNRTPVVHPAYDSPAGPAVGDLNRDGRSDLVAAHFNWLAATVYTQQSTGRLGPHEVHPVDGVGNHPDAAFIADVTGDAKPDVVLATYTKIAILQQR